MFMNREAPVKTLVMLQTLTGYCCQLYWPWTRGYCSFNLHMQTTDLQTSVPDLPQSWGDRLGAPILEKFYAASGTRQLAVRQGRQKKGLQSIIHPTSHPHQTNLHSPPSFTPLNPFSGPGHFSNFLFLEFSLTIKTINVINTISLAWQQTKDWSQKYTSNSCSSIPKK